VKNNESWYEIDDNNIKEIDEDDVINQNAYILIYEKN
jgi:ubiquitin C-terminal hydrolase